MERSARSNRPRGGGISDVVFQILLSLTDEERHGYGIIKEVASRSGGQIIIRPGSLYRAVSRLLADGLIEESETRPDPEEDDERRRYYRLTAEGRSVARREARRLEGIVRSAYAKALIDPDHGLVGREGTNE
jgi:DNA-binding PadR family transcriptional regulator